MWQHTSLRHPHLLGHVTEGQHVFFFLGRFLNVLIKYKYFLRNIYLSKNCEATASSLCKKSDFMQSKITLKMLFAEYVVH